MAEELVKNSRAGTPHTDRGWVLLLGGDKRRAYTSRLAAGASASIGRPFFAEKTGEPLKILFG
jgi:hypothetical protein